MLHASSGQGADNAIIRPGGDEQSRSSNTNNGRGRRLEPGNVYYARSPASGRVRAVRAAVDGRRCPSISTPGLAHAGASARQGTSGGSLFARCDHRGPERHGGECHLALFPQSPVRIQKEHAGRTAWCHCFRGERNRALLCPRPSRHNPISRQLAQGLTPGTDKFRTALLPRPTLAPWRSQMHLPAALRHRATALDLTFGFSSQQGNKSAVACSDCAPPVEACPERITLSRA
jgi:hypothetical protein